MSQLSGEPASHSASHVASHSASLGPRAADARPGVPAWLAVSGRHAVLEGALEINSIC